MVKRAGRVKGAEVRCRLPIDSGAGLHHGEALFDLVARLRAGGASLLDVQLRTDHLASLGAIEVELDAAPISGT